MKMARCLWLLCVVACSEGVEVEVGVSGETVSGETVSGETVSGETVSGETVSGETVSGNTVSGNTVSGDTVSGETMSGDTVSGNTVPGETHAGGDGADWEDRIADKDPYRVMGVDSQATQAEIKRAYRKLSIRWHPDKNAGDAMATKIFAAITAAYAILGDPDKREEHDNFGEKTHGFQTAQQWQRERKTDKAEDFYSNSNLVETLDHENFDSLVMGGDGDQETNIWFVEFYAPWCVHCIQLRDDIKRAASILEGVARVGAMNCEQELNKPICHGKQGVKSYPTLKVLVPSAGHAEKYPWSDAHPRDAEHFVAFVKKTARLSERAAVQHLTTPEDFEERVLADPGERFWVLLFTHSGMEGGGQCPYCAAAGGLFRHLSASLKAVAGIGRVDCAEGAMAGWCDEMMGPGDAAGAEGGSSVPPRFPHIRMFQTGAQKNRGESVWKGAFRQAEDVHLALQIVERVARFALVKEEPKAAVVLKSDEEEEEEEGAMPPVQPDEPDFSFPDAPPSGRSHTYIDTADYSPPVGLLA